MVKKAPTKYSADFEVFLQKAEALTKGKQDQPIVNCRMTTKARGANDSLEIKITNNLQQVSCLICYLI